MILLYNWIEQTQMKLLNDLLISVGFSSLTYSLPRPGCLSPL